jgi:hypothetical protein
MTIQQPKCPACNSYNVFDNKTVSFHLSVFLFFLTFIFGIIIFPIGIIIFLAMIFSIIDGLSTKEEIRMTCKSCKFKFPKS